MSRPRPPLPPAWVGVDARRRSQLRRREAVASLASGVISLEELLDAAEHDPALSRLRVEQVLAFLPGLSARRRNEVLDGLRWLHFDDRSAMTLGWLADGRSVGRRRADLLELLGALERWPSPHLPFST